MQTQKTKQKVKAEQSTAVAEPASQEEAQALSKETEDLLDEIDAVLGPIEEAQATVEGFVQKNGE